MKNRTTQLCILCVAFCALAGCQKTELEQDDNLTAAGTAKLEAVPDEIVLYLGVVKKNDDVSVAKRECDKIINGILALADEYGIDKKCFETDFLKIRKEYVDREGKLLFDGYVLTKNIVIRLTKTEKFDDLCARSVAMGVTHIHDVQFNVKNLDELREKVKDQALADARRKAQWQAKQLGKKLLKVSAIVENKASVINWYANRAKWDSLSYEEQASKRLNIFMSSGAAVNDGSAMYSFGKITVTANVTVTFEVTGSGK